MSKNAESIDLTEVSREQAEVAVRTLIRWAGDDPSREGLLDTPARVVRSYEEFFAGYAQDPGEILARTFSEVDPESVLSSAHTCSASPSA